MSLLVHLSLETSFLACFVHFRAEKTDPFRIYPLHENLTFPRQSAKNFLRNTTEMDIEKIEIYLETIQSYPFFNVFIKKLKQL